ncbi:MAG TPA: S53 family peptidase [Gemmatimonadaceae bacterium]|nr:S53 family peptidase [Gemmatimonadaceae bacterium]
MSFGTRTLVGLTALAALAACSSDIPDSATITAPDSRVANVGQGTEMRFLHAKVCPSAAPQTARCHALVRVDASGSPLATSGPSGYKPVDLASAYALNTSGGAGATIAIVDAYDDGNAESDLAVYRSAFGLPACTTANGCFRKVDQNGGTSYPRGDANWAEEISLDLDMASAICPNCKILLVEAKTSSLNNLFTAVDRAAAMGATVISNSYGAPEFSSEASYESHYNHPGIAITVSSGDNGYGVEYPAASRNVIAVGGTHLVRDASVRGWSETVWSGAGSGCSAYITKPTWQADAGCARRTVADVSAIADPNTGVAVYDTYRLRGGGWLVFGGTSVSAPIIASMYALAGHTSTAQSLYGATSLFDVVSGSNGSCGGSYLCTGKAGYDGPTGNGTPNGLGAF